MCTPAMVLALRLAGGIGDSILPNFGMNIRLAGVDIISAQQLNGRHQHAGLWRKLVPAFGGFPPDAEGFTARRPFI